MNIDDHIHLAIILAGITVVHELTGHRLESMTVLEEEVLLIAMKDSTYFKVYLTTFLGNSERKDKLTILLAHKCFETNKIKMSSFLPRKVLYLTT